MRRAIEYGLSIIGTPYGWWTSGPVPDEEPAWAYNAPPPDPEYVRARTAFCAAVANLMRRAEGYEIPTLGNELYDGGTVAYRGYFASYGVLEYFDLQTALTYGEGTLIGRTFRDSSDQGHVAVVLANGKVLQSYDAGGGWPGVNADAWLEDSHAGNFYEWMVRPENWLPADNADAPPESAEEGYEYWKGEWWTWHMAEGRVSTHLPGQDYETSVDWSRQFWVHYTAEGQVVPYPPTV